MQARPSINSEINRIYVLTQYNSVSLHRHIRQTYQFDRFNGGFVEILAAQQTWTEEQWFQGTADAVRQNLKYFQEPGIEYVLILSGDQLYRMDYRSMLETHKKSGADVTIAAVPVSTDKAFAFGIIQFDDAGRVVGFVEKPKTEEQLAPVRTPPEWLEKHGVKANGRDCLANMGVYLFNRQTLVDLLANEDHKDFGKQVFPASIKSHHVQVHLFDGYWEDIGTIKAFYEANIDLTRSDAPFQLLTNEAPIYTRARFLPTTRVDDATIKQSLIADGCVIGKGSVIENSIVGLRCQIGEGVTIRNTVLMGNDYFELPTGGKKSGSVRPAVTVGNGSLISGAIVDKNVRIGRNAKIELPKGKDADCEREGIVVRDGVIVVPKGTVISDGWTYEAAKPKA